MPNILNLRKEPKPIIIEKVIQAKRIWWLEVLKMVTVITVVSSVVYGISKADVVINPASVVQNFSAIGTVSDVVPTSLSIENARSSDKTGNTSYTFDLSDVKKIENRSYVQLLISDIHVGDKVVVQGILKDSVVTIRRIISFSSTATTSDVVVTATSTATSTASTTSEVASSTASTTETVATSTATSTQSGVSSESVSTSTATSTASTTPDVTATTTATSTDTTTASSTSEVTASSTDPVVTPPDAPASTTPVTTTPPADPAVTPPADSTPVTPPAPDPALAAPTTDSTPTSN